MDRLRELAGRVVRRLRALARRTRDAVRSTRKRTRRRRRRLSKRWKPELLYTYVFEVPDVPVDRDFELVEADRGLLDRMREEHPDEFPERKHGILVDRLDDPDELCWVIVNEAGDLCGYSHATLTDTVNERIGHPLRVPPGEAYLFDSRVFEEHRGRGLHTFAIVRRLELCADRGVERGRVQISSRSAASLASFRRFDPRTEEIVVHVRALDLTFRIR